MEQRSLVNDVLIEDWTASERRQDHSFGMVLQQNMTPTSTEDKTG